MRPIKLIMFDLDGTLVDSIGDITDGTNYFLAKLGRPEVTAHQVRGFIGGGAGKLVEGALRAATPAGREVTADEVRRGVELYVEYNRDHIIHKSALYPGVAETLTALHAGGTTLALVSNKNESLCKLSLKSFGLAGLFSVVFGGDSLHEKKPQPTPLYAAMKSCGFSSAEAMMVGDSAYDVGAGRAAGVVTVGCRYGYGSEEDLRHADHVIDIFSELPGLIRHFSKDVE